MEPEQTLSLQEIAGRLDRAGIPWAVFAGAAASVYGSRRPLTDVDILVPAAEGERVAALFPEGQVEHWESLLRVKLADYDILAGLTTMDLDAGMAARLTRHPVAGASVPVIPPEDNILLKAMWERGQEQGKHDWEDVEAMMSHLPAIDWAYLRWRAGTLGSESEVEKVVARLEALGRRLGKMEVNR